MPTRCFSTSAPPPRDPDSASERLVSTWTRARNAMRSRSPNVMDGRSAHVKSIDGRASRSLVFTSAGAGSWPALSAAVAGRATAAVAARASTSSSRVYERDRDTWTPSRGGARFVRRRAPHLGSSRARKESVKTRSLLMTTCRGKKAHAAAPGGTQRCGRRRRGSALRPEEACESVPELGTPVEVAVVAVEFGVVHVVAVGLQHVPETPVGVQLL